MFLDKRPLREYHLRFLAPVWAQALNSVAAEFRALPGELHAFTALRQQN